MSSFATAVASEDSWRINVTSRRRLPRPQQLLQRVVPDGSTVRGRPSTAIWLRPLLGESSTKLDIATVSVVGRLPTSFPFWCDVLKANDFVLDIVLHGYTIPFVTEPSSARASNNKSALDHPDFVREAIQQLLLSNVVLEVNAPSYCCNPLTVASGKKLRLVLDLSRVVNPHVRYVHFKYEDWSVAEQVIQAGSWFFNWDFTSGYHHVDVNPQQWKYLGFSVHWPHTGQRYFEFTQLPCALQYLTNGQVSFVHTSQAELRPKGN